MGFKKSLKNNKLINYFIKKFKSKLKANKYIYSQIYKIIDFYEYFNLTFFSKSRKDIFEDIFLKNKWGDKDSFSGGGSNLTQTKIVIEELPKLLKKYQIKSIFDIPCGDFYWMKEIDLKNIKYSGGDIVRKIIENNISKFKKANINFRVFDLLVDPIPKSDLIIVRDCFVHFSNKDISCALMNISKSKSKYLLTTNFLLKSINPAFNKNIATGQWRKLNLNKPPFNFSEPLFIISEGCTLNDQEDKTLALWEIDKIPKNLYFKN